MRYKIWRLYSYADMIKFKILSVSFYWQFAQKILRAGFGRKRAGGGLYGTPPAAYLVLKTPEQTKRPLARSSLKNFSKDKKVLNYIIYTMQNIDNLIFVFNTIQIHNNSFIKYSGYGY